MAEIILNSHDGTIKKTIITKGMWGLKPTENCDCNIEISGVAQKYVLGNSNSSFERLLDLCLQTMFTGEVANINFIMKNKAEESFVLKLCTFESKGLIYEWDAKLKYELAVNHKEEGFNLYNSKRYIDASHRFGKGLKLLFSIPIKVDEPPVEVDGIKVDILNQLKIKLFNNLALCFLKHSDYENVLGLCEKALQLDSTNIKALYKRAVAKFETRDYEGSQLDLFQILELEPENKAALEKLKNVNVKVAETNVRVNNMIKKMFGK